MKLFVMMVLLFLSNTLHAQEVEMQGFLYQREDQRWVLAEKPNIKSCCLDKHELIEVIFDDKFPLTQKIVAITGELKEMDGQPTLIAKSIATAGRPFPKLTVAILAIIVVLAFGVWKFRKGA